MRTLSRFTMVCTCLIVFWGTLGSQTLWAQEGPPKVVAQFPNEDELFKGELIVIFDQAITRDPAIAEDTPWLKFSSSLKGKETVGPNFIRFQASSTLSGNPKSYEVQFSEGIRSVKGIPFPAQEPIYVANYIFTPTQLSLHFGEKTETTGLLIRFNAAPSLDSLKNHLTLKDADGTIIKAQLENYTLSNTVLMSFPKQAKQPVSIAIGKGMESDVHHLHTRRDVKYRYPHNGNLGLRKVSLDRDSSDRDHLYLRFSQRVSSSMLKKHLKIRHPETKELYTYQPTVKTSEYHDVLLPESVRDIDSLLVEIHPGLVGEYLGGVDKTLTRTINRRGPPTPTAENAQLLRINRHYWRQRGIKGAVLQVRLNAPTNLTDIEEAFRVSPPIANMKVTSGSSYYFEVEGDWQHGQEYRIFLDEGLSSTTKTYVVRSELSHSVSKPPKVQAVAFGNEDKLFFPLRHRGNITLESRNMDKVTVQVHKVLPNNMSHALESYAKPQQSGYGYNRYSKDVVHEYSQLLGSKVIDIAQIQDAKVSTSVDVKSLLPDGEHGVFVLQANGHKKVVLWTNLGILGNWNEKDMVFFVHDLFSLDAVPNASITVYSSKHQVLAQLTTDAQGLARIGAFDSSLGSPKLAVVHTKNDTSFLHLSPKRTRTNQILSSLPLHVQPRVYDSFFYADRNLYRPGEAMRLCWIVREEQGDAAANMPVMLKAYNTKNQEILSEVIALSDIGTGGFTFQTQKDFLTGHYRLELRIPTSNRVIGTHSVQVEDFIPNRMRATIEMVKETWVAKKEAKITVKAEHLFGGSASKRPVDAQVILNPASITDERWSAYRFRNDSIFKTKVNSLGSGITDEEGKANFSYTYSESNPPSFPLNATVYAQVRELGGRAVTARETNMLFPSDTALGIQLEKAEGESLLTVHAAAIGADMNAATLDRATVTLERKTWHYSVRRLRGYNEPYWDYSYQVISEEEVSFSEGKGSVDLDLPRYGSFRIRLHAKETPQYATQSFYNYGNRMSFSNAAEPELITLSLDKKSYVLGDIAELVIESPFDGGAIVVMQNGSFRDVRSVRIKDGKGILRVPIGAEDVPNLWLRTTVIHEVKGQPQETYPYSSYKAISVPIYNRARALNVELLDMPKKVRPDEPFEVRLKITDFKDVPVAAEVTLALVDEGIHSIKGYANPDPFAWFQRSLSRTFNRAHYYDLVAYNFDPASVGGDQIRKRLASPPNVEDNWVKPVALWSGVVHTDAEGKATVPFDIPDTFNGELRLVALAATATATGAQATSLKSALPYIAKTNIPRFARSGDTFTASLNLFNRTEEACTAHIRWKTTNGFIDGQGEIKVDIPKMEETMQSMPFVCTNDTGSETLVWDIDILDTQGKVLEHIHQSAVLPVRPSATFQSHHELVVLKAGEERTITNTRFQENDLTENELEISTLPTLQLKNPLQYIYTYPYGCVEQTTSKAFPMYMLQHLLGQDPSYNYDRVYVKQRIEEAVDRLFSMQTSSGGLAYWPGGDHPHEYASAYAGHFLTLAYLDSEIEVPEQRYKKLQSYLRRVAENPGKGSGYSNLTRAYATYVVVLSGDPKASELVDRFDHVDMPQSARNYLAWAKAISGSTKDEIEAYLRDAPVSPYQSGYYRNSFASEQRDAAIELMTRMAVDAQDPKIHKLAMSLMRQLEGPYRFNTHQTAFISTSLGKYMTEYAGDSSKAAIQVHTPKEAITLTGIAHRTVEHHGPGARFVLKNVGETAVFLNYSTQGIPLKPTTEAVYEGISLKREFNTTSREFIHGKTYPVQLTLELDEAIDHVVVADLLPAGFEIENTRLNTDALAVKKSKSSGNARPSFMEIRDDRLVLSFNRLAKGKHTFNYVVRAVTPGSFQYPAAHAEAMYNAALRGSTVPEDIIIKRP